MSVERNVSAAATPYLDALLEHFGDRLKTGVSERRLHCGLDGHMTSRAPDAVLFAASKQDVEDAVRLCGDGGIPIIAHGAGTSLEGHLSADRGGLSLDLGALDEIIVVEPDNMLCRVGPGVTREALNRHLRDTGLFFPVDPGANATIGGMAATGASGTTAVRYGTMRDNILSLEVVLPSGVTIETGGKSAKSSAGYNLTNLFVGSEGTLGIITAITLRLHGIPEAAIAATCAFATLAGAVDAVTQAMQLGLPAARIELLDQAQIVACNAYSHLDLPALPTLFVEFHGTGKAIEEDVRRFGDLAEDNGGRAVAVAATADERNTLWKARHDAYFAARALRPGGDIWSTDVCVPIAALADNITAAHADIAAQRLTAPVVGHVGDGNFHVLFVLDPSDPAERAKAEAVNDRMVRRALASGGTCSGEHGVGNGKRGYLIDERGAGAVDLMAALKRTIDPKGLFNPGKILPP